jgi:hypothetical protein
MTPTNSFKTIVRLTACAAVIALFATSCKKKDKDEEVTEEPVSYNVPTTYDFGTIDTIAPKQAIAMLAEFSGYIRKTHVAAGTPVILDPVKLNDYYANTNSPFSTAALNTSTYNLKNATGNAMNLPTLFAETFLDAKEASTNASVKVDSTTASDGKSGKLVKPAVGTTAGRYILVDANGVEYKEFIEKGVMGGVFYFQATTLLNTISGFDNTAKVNGLTAQESAWDKAFAYYGVPVNFPTVKTGLKNWGNYGNSVDDAIGCNATIMNAFIKGRAAISNGDNATRDAQRDIVVKTWEKVAAAKFISYVKGAKLNTAQPADFHHGLSEGVGFILAFKYNSAKTISDADIATLLGYFQTGGVVNLYKVKVANLDEAINKMATIFNIDAAKVK